jgi:hypothetical protein
MMPFKTDFGEDNNQCACGCPQKNYKLGWLPEHGQISNAPSD